jgi:hypothetical protein
MLAPGGKPPSPLQPPAMFESHFRAISPKFINKMWLTCAEEVGDDVVKLPEQAHVEVEGSMSTMDVGALSRRTFLADAKLRSEACGQQRFT